MLCLRDYYNYLGKYNKKDEIKTYHLLPYHSLDVAAVAEALLLANQPFTQDLSQLLEIPEQELITLLCFFIALHDLGKFASAFQLLFPDIAQSLLQPATGVKAYDAKTAKHDRLGYYFWEKAEENILQALTGVEGVEEDAAYKSLEIFALFSFGHHGEPINTQLTRELKLYREDKNEKAALEFIQDLLALFKPRLNLSHLIDNNWQTRLKQVSWHLAGLTVLADWLGSNTDFFPYCTQTMNLESYWPVAQKNAQTALKATDLWKPIKIKPFLSVQEHYGFTPTPLQRWAETVAIDDTPQLFILEDVTGAGKTEAALVLAHRLMEAGAASGFYFGLPTMATSNAMFSRVSEHYLHMLDTQEGSKPSIVLAHGARDMHEQFREAVWPSAHLDANYTKEDTTATAQCNSWLADSRKKALLAPVGVGTIDQTLLAVLPRKHQSLRLLGLNRKVLIYDEVHSADEYMFELLESLLVLHLHQGGSVVLLTATLSKKQRQRLINIWAKHLQLGEQIIQTESFPLATKVSFNSQLEETALASREEVSREVLVNFLHSEDACIETIIAAANKGQCIVWIRNTVNDALEAYQAISAQLTNKEDCLLFHSRFILQDRQRIEAQVLDIFGKHSDGTKRAGKVLIATQVFQESLDADADLMISDICPIDDLIQRAGRLHRHTRNIEGAYQSGISDARTPPVLFVHAPEWQAEPAANWLAENFKTTEYVYRSPGRLWLGMKVLRKLGALRMPEEARELIEAVYSAEAERNIPTALIDQEHKLLGEIRAKVARAQSSLLDWQNSGYTAQSSIIWHEDNTDISTRFSDMETAEVIVLRQLSSGQLTFAAEDKKFALQLSTVKLGVNKYINKMLLIAEQDSRLQELKRSYPKIKFEYLKLWLPEEDANFGYSALLGIYLRNEE